MSINKLIPIVLDSNSENWNDSNRIINNNSEFVNAKEKCFSNYNNTCSFCGYKASETHLSDCGLELFYKNGNPDNLKQSNLLPICSYCKICFNLSYAEEKKCVLVWLPELKQFEISLFYRILFSLRKNVEKYKSVNENKSKQNRMQNDNTILVYNILDSFESLNTSILARASYAERIIGTSRPGELGLVFENIKKTINDVSEASNLFNDGKKNNNDDKFSLFYNNRSSFLKDIKLIPTIPLADWKYVKSNFKTLSNVGFAIAQAFIEKEGDEE